MDVVRLLSQVNTIEFALSRDFGKYTSTLGFATDSRDDCILQNPTNFHGFIQYRYGDVYRIRNYDYCWPYLWVPALHIRIGSILR